MTIEEYLEMVARMEQTGLTPGVPRSYLGAPAAVHQPFSGLSASFADTGPSSYAQQALDIQKEMTSSSIPYNKARGMTMYPTGSTNPMEQALTLNPADQAYVYGPSDAAARTRYTSGVAHDPTVRTITDPVEQELALMERRRANPRQGPIPTPLSQAKTIPANWAGETVPMGAFLAQQGSVQSGTRDAHYMPDGTVRNSAGEIIDVPAGFSRYYIRWYIYNLTSRISDGSIRHVVGISRTRLYTALLSQELTHWYGLTSPVS